MSLVDRIRSTAVQTLARLRAEQGQPSGREPRQDNDRARQVADAARQSQAQQARLEQQRHEERQQHERQQQAQREAMQRGDL